MTFGEKLRQLRTEQFLTQRAVADAIGVSVQAYDAYEQNQYFPSDGKIYERLAILFETTVMKLTDVDHEPDRQNSESEPSRTFGQRLYLQRLMKEWTMSQVAKKLGISEFKYRQMEYQNLRPETVEEYERIAELYGCEVSYFMEGDVHVTSRVPSAPPLMDSEIESPPSEQPMEAEQEEAETEEATTEEPTTETDKKGAQMTFGEKLKDLREKQGMTQGDVANALGITSKSYGHYERDLSTPRLKGMYEKLADVLDTTVEYLTGESEEPNAENAPKSELTLGQKLLILRKELKLSQIDAAKLIGISLDVYKRMEARNGRPRSIDVYDKIAAAFGCDVSYLAEGDYRVKISPEASPSDVAADSVENMDAVETDAVETAENTETAAGTILNDDLTIENATDEVATQMEMETMTEESASDSEPIAEAEEKIEEPTEPIKSAPIELAPIEPAVKNTASPSADVMENIVIEKPTERIVENASVEAITLVSRLSMLLAGNRLTQSEKDALMVSLNSAYWSSR